MEWIKIIAPLFGVLLGWGLSEKAKLWADIRTDKRKVKRLLFYILELRFHFTRELNVQKEIDSFIDSATSRLKSEFGDEVELGIDMYKPFIMEIVKSNFSEDKQLDFLEENIDSVIVDLSEVFPVFAYELSGQYRIKERLNKSDNYLAELEGLTGGMPFDLKNWLQPKLTKGLLKDLDENLNKIALKIDKKTAKDVKEKIVKMDSRDNSDVQEFLEDYIAKVKDSLK
ncbi:MAG: hypothetical protein N4A35_01675 [Flavobacteriales bacterium]|jgi:hypothetical protein|nr:hypothetical protein [Flavobacteriales bacterium]